MVLAGCAFGIASVLALLVVWLYKASVMPCTIVWRRQLQWAVLSAVFAMAALACLSG